jgi:competence protein ComK
LETVQEYKEYIIQPLTMALLPMDGPYGEWWTIVVEKTGIVVVQKKPLDIIDDSCGYFGHSFSGAKQGAWAVTGITRMPPLAVSAELDLIIFPLASPENRDCSWLVHLNVESWGEAGRNATVVRFSNYQTFTFDISYTAFEIKACRAAQYRCLLREHTARYQISRPPAAGERLPDLHTWIRKKDNGTYQIIRA